MRNLTSRLSQHSMNSTKSGLRNFIRALQTEFGRHRQTFLGGSSAPVLDPRVIGVTETSLGGDGDDLMHATSLPTLASLADWSRVRFPAGSPDQTML